MFQSIFITLATTLHLPNATLSDADNLLTLRIDLFSSCPPSPWPTDRPRFRLLRWRHPSHLGRPPNFHNCSVCGIKSLNISAPSSPPQFGRTMGFPSIRAKRRWSGRTRTAAAATQMPSSPAAPHSLQPKVRSAREGACTSTGLVKLHSFSYFEIGPCNFLITNSCAELGEFANYVFIRYSGHLYISKSR